LQRAGPGAAEGGHQVRRPRRTSGPLEACRSLIKLMMRCRDSAPAHQGPATGPCGGRHLKKRRWFWSYEQVAILQIGRSRMRWGGGGGVGAGPRLAGLSATRVHAAGPVLSKLDPDVVTPCDHRPKSHAGAAGRSRGQGAQAGLSTVGHAGQGSRHVESSARAAKPGRCARARSLCHGGRAARSTPAPPPCIYGPSQGNSAENRQRAGQ